MKYQSLRGMVICTVAMRIVRIDINCNTCYIVLH